MAPSPVPFRPGGAERLFSGLTTFLNEETEHDADLIKLPSPEHDLPSLLASYRSFAELDVSHFDAVITTKYPSWMVDHRHHVVYMLHKLRGLYDTYHFTGLPTEIVAPPPEVEALVAMMSADAGRDALPSFFDAAQRTITTLGPDHPVLAFPGPLTRRVVHYLDGIGLSPPSIRRYSAISRTVAQRPDYFPDVAIHHVVPPTSLQGLHSGPYETVFTASRLDGPKRIHLLVEAMQFVREPIRLVIAGTGPEEGRLRDLAVADPRIVFLGHVTDDELVAEYSRALVVPFVPYDEDLGLITLEAMLSEKPVLTTHDAGGVAELVSDGTTGLIVEPAAEALGDAIEALAADPKRAAAMGQAGLQVARDVTWARVVETLLPEGVATPSTPELVRARPHVVYVATYPLFPPQHGGQLRGAHLARGLAQHFDVEVVALGDGETPGGRSPVEQDIHQTAVTRSEEHKRAERELSRSVGWLSVTDIAASLFISETPAFAEALGRALKGAAAVIVAHPYLVRSVRQAAPHCPLIFDSVDVESEQKRAFLPDTEIGRELAHLVSRLEENALASATVVTTCSERDTALLDEATSAPVNFQVMPNGTDLAIRFVNLEERRRNERRWLDVFEGDAYDHVVAFIASWHPPNIEAARVILRAASRTPECLFVLAGRHADAFAQDRDIAANVMLLGSITDPVKRGLLASASVALNPMLSGSGTNLKLLEYFAAGVPVVSTSYGARGIGAAAGEHYIEARIAELPEAIRVASAGSEEIRSMVKASRRLVESSFDWRRIGDRLAAIVAELHRVPAHTDAS